MDLITNIVNSQNPLTILVKSFILDFWLGSEYVSVNITEIPKFVGKIMPVGIGPVSIRWQDLQVHETAVQP